VKFPKVKKYSRVEVEWLDHYSDSSGWTTNQQDDKDAKFRCTTCGYFLGEDNIHIFIAQTLNTMDQHANMFAVLKPVITKVTKF
jgi:hypothetical protein